MRSVDSPAVVKSPGDCAESEFSAFVQFVREGGEVASAGLEGRVRAARLLSFVRGVDGLLGVAGLKHPSANHRAEVASGSGVDLPADAFPLELGWVFVALRARGRGKSLELAAALVEREGARSGMFATSRSDNAPMHRTLAKLGFQRKGSAWPSGQNPADLWLFLRAPG